MSRVIKSWIPSRPLGSHGRRRVHQKLPLVCGRASSAAQARGKTSQQKEINYYGGNVTGKERGMMAPQHILRERVWISAASSRAQWCLSSPAVRGQHKQEQEMQFNGTQALGESLPCAIKTLSQRCCLQEGARGSQPALPGGVGRGAGNGNWMLLQSWVGIKGTSQKPAGSTSTSKMSGNTTNHPASPTCSCLVLMC